MTPTENKRSTPKLDMVRAGILLAILLGFIVLPNYMVNFQAVDGPGKSQEMVCDDTAQTITFPNYVTAYAWLEKIRWEEPKAEFSIHTEFAVGKPLQLSYRCRRFL